MALELGDSTRYLAHESGGQLWATAAIASAGDDWNSE
jgi:hypothetical protein